MNRADQIIAIKKNFNFKFIWLMMVAVNWEWESSHGVPSIKELKDCATELLKKVKDNSNVSTGGFEASMNNGDLCLTFTADEIVASDYIDDH